MNVNPTSDASLVHSSHSSCSILFPCLPVSCWFSAMRNGACEEEFLLLRPALNPSESAGLGGGCEPAPVVGGVMP